MSEKKGEKKRLKVAVVYGGKSSEHEVSLRSAASVLKNLDPSRYEVVPVAIDRKGKWILNDAQRVLPSNSHELVVQAGGNEVDPMLLAETPSPGGAGVDVVFPVLHGTHGEDGAVQGLFELAGIAYVGAGILGSAVGMDKEVAKRLVAAAGLPVVPSLCIRKGAWDRDQNKELKRITESAEWSYPIFVKPACLGSSVGVSKVKRQEDLARAIDHAFEFDEKVLVEHGLDVREIEVSVLENERLGLPPLTSVPGEIRPTHEFYSYEAKYLDDNGAELLIPAELSESQREQAQSLAARVFEALECEGMARVDLFLTRGEGEFYFNEINTIPGFTSISMYPKLWEASGLNYQALLSRLIDLAVTRRQRRAKLSTGR